MGEIITIENPLTTGNPNYFWDTLAVALVR